MRRLTRRQALIGLGSAAAAAPFAGALGLGRVADLAGAQSPASAPGGHAGMTARPHGAHDPMTSVHGADAPVSAPPDALDALLYPPPRRSRSAILPARRAPVEYELVAEETEIEVAKGVKFAAWTYNGTAPGPVIRATEGDLLRVKLVNASRHPHSIHLHGIHPANMDGVFEQVQPGESFTYEVTARPAGMHVYHCHTIPLKKHIHKGLYGAFIIDPKRPRPPAKELVMVMNGFDTDGDGENNVYTINGIAFFHARYPIRVKRSQTVRIYLANMTEFDAINSLHLHGEFFRYYPTGSRPDQFFYTDTVQLCQGERGIIEIDFTYPGRFMFHAHQSEFADLGWIGFFDVEDR